MVMKLGSTGEFPRGKLNDDDEGALRLAVTAHEGVVKIIFGKPVAWLGLPKKEALELAATIKKHADSLL
jgi:hypothetical protein